MSNKEMTKKLTGNYNLTKMQRFFLSFKGYKKHIALVVMFLPVLAYFIIFKYIPMYGITIAFKDYKLVQGIMHSPWSDPLFSTFIKMFKTDTFVRAVKNTLIISVLKLLFQFPMPIILALALNEIRNLRYKKVVQTISYLPHFLSWVIIAGLFKQLLSPTTGFVNTIVEFFGGESIFFMASNEWFRTTLVFSNIWQTVGWGSILYLAALAGISPHLYEAAECDGASRMQKIWHITLPGILPTIVVLFILRIGYLLDGGFDQVFNFYNEAVYKTGDIIDTYVYRIGLGRMKYSNGAASGLFKNVIGFILVIITNSAGKRLSGNGLW